LNSILNKQKAAKLNFENQLVEDGKEHFELEEHLKEMRRRNQWTNLVI
jgi:hypothetical protein